MSLLNMEWQVWFERPITWRHVTAKLEEVKFELKDRHRYLSLMYTLQLVAPSDRAHFPPFPRTLFLVYTYKATQKISLRIKGTTLHLGYIIHLNQKV